MNKMLLNEVAKTNFFEFRPSQYQSIINTPPATTSYVVYNGNTINWAANTANTPVDGMHIVVVDQLGQFTGVAGAIMNDRSPGFLNPEAV